MSAASQTSEKTDTIAADAIFALPTSFFGPYEAVAQRLRSAAAGTTVPLYVVTQGSFSIRTR